MLIGCASSATHAQQALTRDPIIVVGQRPLFGIPPERALSDADIQAYGLGTLGELLDEVTTENGDNPGEPVILVNGERVASSADIEALPPEVVAELQVLPRGSAARVGVSAERRVYNIVLKPNADTFVGRAAARTASEGGWSGGRGDLSYTNVKGPRRLNGMLRVRREGSITEDERDITQPAGSPERLGEFRTLQPNLRSFQLNGSAADRLAPWLAGSLTGRLTNTRRRSLLGLDTADEPLRRRSRSLGAEMGLSLNADIGEWLITMLGEYDYERRRTLTDRLTDPARTSARETSASSELTAVGPLFQLPAGTARLTFGGGVSRDSISASRSFDGDDRSDRFVQRAATVKAGIELPIASRSNGYLPELGELTASAQIVRTRVSELGWLANHTLALSWQPSDRLRLFGSLTSGETSPAIAFIADPLLETPGVRYFDPLRGETVDVTEISGGDRTLRDQNATGRRFSANFKPLRSLPLQLTTEYSFTRNRDIVTALPPASDLIFLVFAERFARDPSTGVLIGVDVRPVQFARETREQLRTGLNLNLALGTSERSRSVTANASDSGEDDVPSSSNSARRPRLQLNMSHIWLLKSELVLREGIDAVDLLSRAAIGFGGLTRARHQLSGSVGYLGNGFGLRFAGQHRSRSFLSLVSARATDVLRFSPLTTFNLRSWLETGALTPRHGWLGNSRITISVLNIGNNRQRVTDANGLVPLAYQAGYQDPAGRTVEFEFRKSF